jgi:hypothetical protein
VAFTLQRRASLAWLDSATEEAKKTMERQRTFFISDLPERN